MEVPREIGAGASTPEVPEEVVQTLARFLNDMRFGSVEIVIHEGRITQIERKERVRVGLSSAPSRC